MRRRRDPETGDDDGEPDDDGRVEEEILLVERRREVIEPALRHGGPCSEGNGNERQRKVPESSGGWRWEEGCACDWDGESS